MLKKLLNKKMKFLKNQQGLTLIELLVVIVILGIIAAVAIPMVMGQQDSAAKNTNTQNVSILQDAVNRYYTLNSKYPAALDDLTLAEASNNHKGGPFLQKIPSVEKFGTCNETQFTYDDAAYTVDSVNYKAGTVRLPVACVK